MRHVLLTSAALVAVMAAAGCATTAEDTSMTAAPEAAPAEAAPVAQAPAAPVISAATQEAMRTNPLLAEWTGPFEGTPPWDKVRPELFPAAFEAGIELLRADIRRIVDNPEPATFANSFVPYQDAGRVLDRVESMFGVMTNNMNTPAYQALDKEWSPKLQGVYDEITFNPAVFARVQAVYNDRGDLTAEQRRLVERTYRSLIRNGAQLNAEQKAELGRINQELAGHFSDFASKVVNDENTWITIDSKAQLAGLPDSMVAAMASGATERKLPGKWVVVNTRSSVDPFLTFSSNRALRERVWKEFKNRGDNGDAEDTNATIAQILKLRADRAKLLGFPTHAHWRMDDTMAKDPAKAQELMMRVWPAAVARVNEEVADMKKIAARDGVKTFEPWDYLYYAEKVRKARYALDQNEIKPYFELNNMINASYYTAEQLYGITFKEVTGQVPVWHPDVRVYEVRDKGTNAYRGLFYRDDFARPGKRSGAWATGYRGHETFAGKKTPLSSNNNNFVKGGPGEPILISVDDAETLFHEFGHALHSLLSEVNYPGLAGTPRDYVEYPSQVMEHWVLTRPILDRFAKHYKTGQPMPQALVNKIQAAQTFNQGYATVEYLSSALVDMALHNRATPVSDPDAFERETLAAIGMPREIAMRHRLPQFNHLFTSDAYSAGYYSYLWSEVMDADTWAAFEESGNVFDPVLAQKMRQYILAPGNTTDRAEAFRAFRGRDPDVTALLRVRGFPTEPARAGDRGGGR